MDQCAQSHAGESADSQLEPLPLAGRQVGDREQAAGASRFRAAVAMGYESPDQGAPGAPQPPRPTPPDPGPGPEPPTPTPPDEGDYLSSWDARLDLRGTKLTVVVTEAGEIGNHVTEGYWYDEQEAQGRHNVFVTLLDEQGNLIEGEPVTWFWQDGEETKLTEIKSDPWLSVRYSCDFAMYVVAPAYGVRIADGLPTDVLTGLGLGDLENPQHKIHTAYRFTFQRLPNKVQPPTPPPHTEYVLPLQGAHLREAPTTKSESLIAIPYREAVSVYDLAEGEDGYLWAATRWQYHDGFVRSDLLGLIQPEPIVPPPAPEPTPGELVHPLPGSVITQHFYQDPPAYAQFNLPGHNGTDFGGRPMDTPVRCMVAGRVIRGKV